MQLKQFLALSFLLSLLSGCAEYHVVNSVAMQPILSPGDRLKTEKIEHIVRFDIVVIDTPVIEIEYAFRVVGLPEEKIKFEENGILVNGEKLNLPDSISFSVDGVGSSIVGIEREYQIGKDRYFVIGDNMKDSRDSRIFGAVPLNSIKGIINVREE